MRRNLHKTLSWTLALVLAASALLAGCAQSPASSAAAPQSPPAPASSAPESLPPSGPQTITDHAGRTVELPAQITSVYSSSPVGTMLMYTFDELLVTGRNTDISSDEKDYFTQHYQDLPNLGGWYGKGNQGNVEEIIKAAPDMVLASGTTQSAIDQAEELQQQLGIPVVLVESDLEFLPKTYRFLGELLGNQSRGEELAAYTEDTLAQAKKITASIPQEEKLRVYYAEEQDGLHTDPAGSLHSQLIELCGGINVAECEVTPGYGRTAVSMEQVMAWDPQLIICCMDNGSADSSSYNTVLTDAKWAEITAVKDGLVFQTPIQPQNWFDRPPSVNTIIGIKWAHSIFYPDYVDYDIRQEAKDFYQLFYHVELTDQDVEAICQNALRES